MHKCEFCGEEFLKSDGCDVALITLNNGKEYLRIAVGDEGDLFYGYDDETFRCHDCNALYGHFHHAGCDCEMCPECKKQLIDCDC